MVSWISLDLAYSSVKPLDGGGASSGVAGGDAAGGGGCCGEFCGLITAGCGGGQKRSLETTS